MIRRMIILFAAAVLLAGEATGQEFSVGDGFILENGEPKKVKDLAQYSAYVVLITSDGGSEPVGLGDALEDGDELSVKAGMNLELNGKQGDKRWINYNSGVRLQLESPNEPLKILGGELISEGHRDGGLASRFLKAFGRGTDFYIDARGETDLLYVIEGEVSAHAGGDTLDLLEGDAVEANEQGLQLRELPEPDVARIKEWRDELKWADLSWFGQLIRVPLRYPILTTAAVGLVGGVVAYEWGRSNGEEDSELTVRVEIP